MSATRTRTHTRTRTVTRVRVERRFRFCAAHYLPHDDGPCNRVHGHNFELWLSVEGEPSGAQGMVLHTDRLKAQVEPLIEALDHHRLNDLLDNPTMENTARFIWDELAEGGLELARLELWETENNRVVIEVAPSAD